MRQGTVNNLNELVVKGSCIPLFGMAFRSKFIPYLGNLPENITNEDDFVGFIAVASVGISICEDILYSYRIHQNSMSNWVMSDDFHKIKAKFHHSTENRIDNFQAIMSRLEAIIDDYYLRLPNDIDFTLFRQRISLHEKYQNLAHWNVLSRVRLIPGYWGIISARDIIIILFNYHGILLIRYIKNLRDKFILMKNNCTRFLGSIRRRK